jgi:hypothetical protein
MSSLAVSRQREHLASSNCGWVGERLLDVGESKPDDLVFVVVLIIGDDIGFGWESVRRWESGRP